MPDESRVISLKPKPKAEPLQPPMPPAPPPFVREEPRRPRRRGDRTALYAALIALALIGAGAYAWWTWADRGAEPPTQSSEDAETEERTGDLVARIGELIVLPEGEEPTVATVTDPELLRDQVFFANAKEGDVVLIYTKAQKAYLYDPEAHKLVEVAPLTIQ